jgi:hypothetical protein
MLNKLSFCAFVLLLSLLTACDLPAPTPEPTSTPELTPTPQPTETPPQPSIIRPGQVIVDQRTVGDYVIKLWGDNADLEFVGGYGHFSIERDGRVTMVVDYAHKFPDVPAADLTGEGNPDVVLEQNCGSVRCYTTILLDFGPEPVEKFKIWSGQTAQGDSGRAEFVDLDDDGYYELITHDGIRPECSGSFIKVILQYWGGEGYQLASSQFPEQYVEEIEWQINRLDEEFEREEGVDDCSIARMVTLYMYMGRPEEARAVFERYYTADDAETVWLTLAEGIQQGRFYTE